jgi:hypothetical protein
LTEQSLKEMLRWGLVQKIGRGPCKNTGKTDALIWDVTDKKASDKLLVARKVYQVIATGLSFREAVDTFCAAVGWTIETFLIPEPAAPLEATVKTTDGQTFAAVGLKVPGGVVLVEWR